MARRMPNYRSCPNGSGGQNRSKVGKKISLHREIAGYENEYRRRGSNSDERPNDYDGITRDIIAVSIVAFAAMALVIGFRISLIAGNWQPIGSVYICVAWPLRIVLRYFFQNNGAKKPPRVTN